MQCLTLFCAALMMLPFWLAPSDLLMNSRVALDAASPIISPVLGISVPVTDPRDPAYEVLPGQGYDGVALILLSEGDNCTGSLLPSGRHLLTAAHCFEEAEQDGEPTLDPGLDQVTVLFNLPQGKLEIEPVQIEIHPAWDDLDGFNGDLAIIHLAETLPPSVPRYELYRQSDEVGQVFTRLGYGVMATGEQGEFDEDESMVLRRGQNRYEALGELYNEVDGDPDSYIQPGKQLLYDFDSGRRENDALGIEYGLADLGLGAQEIGSSGGDSGGPAFIDGKIAGISSSGGSPDRDGIDVTPENDTSFGEYFFDTRVSAYADYIDQAIAREPGLATATVISEPSLGPSPVWLAAPLLLALAGGWAVLKRRSH